MKKAIFLSLFILSQFKAFSQPLTALVTDNYKMPVSNVLVLNLSNGVHEHTNSEGIFIFEKLDLGDTLKLTHVSFEPLFFVVKTFNPTKPLILKKAFLSIEEVQIQPEIDALNLITQIDIETTPVKSSQDILQKVPGLFIGQHAGGGKAEQIFLRGFDIDHGTDITINVDGLPVNMVSHAHGQGYADLHFVIPETVEQIEFGKGAYYSDKGNFNTAGYVDYRTKNRLERSLIKLEMGQFNTHRLLSMFKILDSKKHNSYLASEYIGSDGPFESPQNFKRINLVGKYSGRLNDSDFLNIKLSHFTSSWDASGQIPDRAVKSGMITRFGAIDDTEGGNTSRTNLLFNHVKMISKKSSLKSMFYYNKYNFELYSNFTFFLEDPINGDQIRQRESRDIIGIVSEYTQDFSTGNWQAGLNLRNDAVSNSELSHTKNRITTLENNQLGDIIETNLGAYLNLNLNLNNWTINPSLRLDHFNFQYNNHLANEYNTQTSVQSILSPKLNILYHPSNSLHFYLKSGKGFHSNDTRVVVNEKERKTLPASYGFDAGFIYKPLPNIFINAAYWYLFLEQEFVYIGDAGVVEPSGKTRRQGFDFSLRYQTLEWLLFNFDANYAHARSVEEEKGNDFIPLAPDFTMVTGISVNHKKGYFGNINVRHIKDRPANEDNSIVAHGYTVTDMNLGFNWPNLSLGIQIQNLLNTEWDETQFATLSRLENEQYPVEEIHFTPGTPFNFKASLSYKF